MKVVKSSESVVITLDQLRERLSSAESGILLWISPIKPTWRILKGPYQSASNSSVYTYGWATPYFNKGYDTTNMDMTISSLEELIAFISKQSEVTGNQFHWFPNRQDFIEWIRKTNTI